MSAHVSAPPSRAKAIGWAREVIATGAVVIDTETTGLGPDAEICDIGIVRIDGTVLLDCLVRPSKPIPAEATAVHGITDEMVSDAEPWSVIYGRLIDALGGKRGGSILVYNLDYDLTIINQCCRAEELPEFAKGDQWQCAMLAYSDFDGTPGKYRGQMKWHKLDAAAARFGIPPGGHRALADAETTRRVVVAMAASGVCRSCGCTDDDCRQCVEATGVPCYWAEVDLCSRCADVGAIKTVDVMDDLGITHAVPVSLADLLDEYGFDDDEVGRMGREAGRR